MNNSGNSYRELAAKKRLMFVTQEDFYFLTYNLMISLHGMECDSDKKELKDYRKLAFLIDFVSDQYLNAVIFHALREGSGLSGNDKTILESAYTKGRDRLPFVNRLIHTLEKNKLIKVDQNNESKEMNIYLTSTDTSNKFFNSDLFTTERNNVEKLILAMPKLRTLSFSKLLEKLFRDNGVTTWLD